MQCFCMFVLQRWNRGRQCCSLILFIRMCKMMTMVESVKYWLITDSTAKPRVLTKQMLPNYSIYKSAYSMPLNILLHHCYRPALSRIWNACLRPFSATPLLNRTDSSKADQTTEAHYRNFFFFYPPLLIEHADFIHIPDLHPCTFITLTFSMLLGWIFC